MYVSIESKLHILRMKHFLNCSFQMLMVILITILNYKIFLAGKSRLYRGLNPDLLRVKIHAIHKPGSLFSQTGDTQNQLAKIAITLEPYKIA